MHERKIEAEAGHPPNIELGTISIKHRALTETFFLLFRPDLKLVLMSATLNSEMFSSYFGIVIQLAFHIFFWFQNIWVYCRCNILCVVCGFFFWVLDIHNNCLARSVSLPREHFSSYI